MKNRLFILFTILIFLSTVYFAEATSYKNNLIHYIAQLKNKIPKRYIAPTDTQVKLLRDAAGFTMASQFAGATRCAGAVGYSLKSITHINGSTYYILQSNDPKSRPWGTYVFYLATDKKEDIIEVPHPVEEKNTSGIGVKSFINSKSKAFLLSGSRKGSGDVTLDPDCVFNAIHEETDSETSTVAMQIHGFNKKEYPQIVLTSGTPVAIQAMDALIDKLMLNDFTVGVYDGNQYQDTGSTQNEQAKYTNSIGGSFIGIFLNQPVHNSKTKSSLVIDSIQEYTLSETTT